MCSNITFDSEWKTWQIQRKFWKFYLSFRNKSPRIVLIFSCRADWPPAVIFDRSACGTVTRRALKLRRLFEFQGGNQDFTWCSSCSLKNLKINENFRDFSKFTKMKEKRFFSFVSFVDCLTKLRGKKEFFLVQDDKQTAVELFKFDANPLKESSSSNKSNGSARCWPDGGERESSRTNSKLCSSSSSSRRKSMWFERRVKLNWASTWPNNNAWR